MFEKEAKIYKETVIKEHLQNPFPRSVEDVWQDGAEFGYKKGRNEAKEIIKELLATQSRLDPYRDIFKDRILKAEQFLKETE